MYLALVKEAIIEQENPVVENVISNTEYKTEKFEGPRDLLLFLIKKN